MTDEFAHPGQPIDVQQFKAEALGEPGQRRFRLLVVVGGETWIIWMEKQQMQALGLALAQILEQASRSQPVVDSVGSLDIIDDSTENQFRLGRVELGFDETDDSLVMVAHDIQAEDDDPGLNMRFSQGQARAFIHDAAVLAAAGRPMCPMCGYPKDPEGHVCPEQNGHLPLKLDDTMRSDS